MRKQNEFLDEMVYNNNKYFLIKSHLTQLKKY